jgi:hypothetical protein
MAIKDRIKKAIDTFSIVVTNLKLYVLIRDAIISGGDCDIMKVIDAFQNSQAYTFRTYFCRVFIFIASSLNKMNDTTNPRYVIRYKKVDPRFLTSIIVSKPF